MLAEKRYEYSYGQTLEQQRQEELRRLQEREQQAQEAADRVRRKRLKLLAGIFLAGYLAFTWISAQVVAQGQALLALQGQAQMLKSRNAELKIEVEQLKNPERIMGVAQSQLGLEVARSNIFVQKR